LLLHIYLGMELLGICLSLIDMKPSCFPY
jgi:hypothetical protein